MHALLFPTLHVLIECHQRRSQERLVLEGRSRPDDVQAISLTLDRRLAFGYSQLIIISDLHRSYWRGHCNLGVMCRNDWAEARDVPSRHTLQLALDSLVLSTLLGCVKLLTLSVNFLRHLA